MLVLMILAAVWAAVLVPPIVRNRRDARPDNSVVSFRAQLSTLERATPGTSLRIPGPGEAAPPRISVPMTRADVKRRRREVLVGLVGATGFTFLLVVAAGGTLPTLLFLASAGSLAAYVYALRQLQLRALERDAKVRVLLPRTAAAPSLGLRRSATS